MSARRGLATVLGAGTIGAGWVARFALAGQDVRVFDPDAGGGARIAATMDRARAALPALYDVALPPEGTVRQVTTISEAVADAHWIQDCTPDRLELKRKLFQKVQEHCSPDAILASSSAGFTLPELQGCATRPAQILRARPADPVYLLPQVQLEGTAPALLARAGDWLASLGMAPADIASSAALVATCAGDNGTLRDRDDTLVALLRALKARGVALTAPITAHEARLAPPPHDPDTPAAPVTMDRQVPITWVDYNGHMNEARYVTAFSKAADRLLLWAGMDAACIASGHSVFTVETHVRYLAEVRIGDRIRVTTRVLQGGGRKFHVWHELSVAGRLCATGEQLLLHVDLASRRSALPPGGVAAWLARAATAQMGLPLPDGLGRHVGAGR